MRRLILSLLGSVIFAGITHAQQKYWIYPKDKMESKEALLEHAQQLRIEPIVTSEWLNAYSALLEKDQAAYLLNSNEVRLLTKIDTRVKLMASNKNYNLGRALTQIKSDTLIKLGLSGKGIKVGIIDAGFLDADKANLLTSIIDEKRVSGYKNYIETEIENPYIGNTTTNDTHGTVVFQFLAGANDSKKMGLAYNAHFYLARTDQADREYHGEEDYWIAALEWMHSQGVRLVNSSLGYSDGFDDPKTDYKPEHVDGEFSAITRAAEIANKEKGMTIVISAGNDGNKDFKIISIPADAEGIISVGSSGYRYWNKLDYSSIGPEHLNAVKPEIACYASGGTSFAAPIITGLIACLMEYKPEITNVDILNVLKKSGHLYPYPNNYLGYGVPNVEEILMLLHDSDTAIHKHELINPIADTVSIELKRSSNIMAFHKKNNTIVNAQEKLHWRNNRVLVYRYENSANTTVATEEYVWEIEWPK